jgi:molybdopterin converting factor small subunit
MREPMVRAPRVIRVKVRYFGSLYGYLGTFEDVIELPEPEPGKAPSVEDALSKLRELRPEFSVAEGTLPMIWVYVNGKQVLNKEKTKLEDGDTILLVPPFYEGG